MSLGVGSEPTYEGLKRVSHSSPPSFASFGSEPTYEGLKPMGMAVQIASGRGSEPTYEGLKPASCSQGQPGRAAGFGAYL